MSCTGGTTAKQLRVKLENIATTFLVAESESEVNVQGCSRVEVLCAIKAAIEASRNHPVAVSGEGPWSWVLATAATKALIHLTQEIYPLIFDGLWPRFLVSDEFKEMINTKVCGYIHPCSSKVCRLLETTNDTTSKFNIVDVLFS